jgi:hypothetical protein
MKFALWVLTIHAAIYIAKATVHAGMALAIIGSQYTLKHPIVSIWNIITGALLLISVAILWMNQ